MTKLFSTALVMLLFAVLTPTAIVAQDEHDPDPETPAVSEDVEVDTAMEGDEEVVISPNPDGTIGIDEDDNEADAAESTEDQQSQWISGVENSTVLVVVGIVALLVVGLWVYSMMGKQQ